jgi:hypothetical protein
LEGADINENYDYPNDEWFYYECAKKFGWTPLETDEQPTYVVSWMLAINRVVEEIEVDNQD